MAKREFIEFNNRKFYLCPENGYYEAKITIGNKRITLRLQRVVWEFYNGAIPENCHIHHIDGNKQNNDISNLKLVSASEHAKIHSKKANKEFWHSEKMRKASEKGREECKKWHNSETGKKWHSEHQKETVRKNIIKKICTDCGGSFNTWHDVREQSLCRKCRDKLFHRKKQDDKKQIGGQW